MGELKQVAAEQQTLVERVKSASQQIYLANLGLAAKAETEGKKQYDKIVAAGTTARGADASKALVVAVGLVEVLKAEAEKLKGTDIKEQASSIKQRLAGLKLKEETLKLFDELVAEGEKRQAA